MYQHSVPRPFGFFVSLMCCLSGVLMPLAWMDLTFCRPMLGHDVDCVQHCLHPAGIEVANLWKVTGI